MEVDKILQEISKYTFTKENVMEFITQESKKFSTLSFYKHLLLSIFDGEAYLEPLIASFYHLEYGMMDSSEEVSICYQNKEVKKTKNDLFLEKFTKTKNVIYEFTNGDSRSLKEIFSYGKNLSSCLDVYKKEIESAMQEVLESYEALVQKFSMYDEKLLDLRKAKKDAQKGLKSKNPLVIYERKFLKNGEVQIKSKTYKWFKNLAYKKYAMKIDLQIESLKKERIAFREEEDQILENMGDLFSFHGADSLWKAILTKFFYYNRRIPLQEVIAQILMDGTLYKMLEEDVYCSLKIIQDYPKLCGYIKNGNALVFVCKKIRESFKKIDNNAWDVNVRKVDVQKSKENPYRIYGYQDLPQKMEELSRVFLEVLKEKTQILFVKKCANFYLDLVIVQPFLEGNIRTAKILESLMLAIHNILIPSKYAVLDVSNFVPNLYKTYGEVEQDLVLRYTYFYPTAVSKRK